MSGKDDAVDEGIQTKAVHAGRDRNTTHAVTPPIWQTTTFRADSSAHFAEIATAVKPSEFYTRYGNPTHSEVEATLVSMESGEAALLTGSGMGAIFASVMCGLRAGDHVVAQRDLYAGTATLFTELLPRWGIECSFVEQTSADRFAEAVRPNTKLIYAETPTNPLMRITPLRAVAELGRRRRITTVVDNTFATPVNQRPLELGIDVVVHSATKYLGGHSDITAGCVVSTRAFIERAWKFSLVSGAALSPFDAWLMLRGLRTLGIRVERHNSNALALARFLESHPKVERVHYPGLESHPQHALAREQMSGYTGILSVELGGDYERAERFISSLKLGTYAASLGGFETLVVQPAAMWSLQLSPEQRREMGVSDTLIRVSVGLEDERDLIKDFAQALDA
ncbi:MAG TPA: aminotransferase class I/II-fold pyridoxal phosphate-dependent enzyme [Pyrinomonadaceae bacterium]|jgi:cystathionine beta-lyase/cystathionine gamma-synthase|nr:aminotransferase class I/II-fold pyridoxal phosphate-dependent enzyme [Pyrinomonadaceae bacterium]